MTAKEFLMLGWRIESRIDAREAECARLRDRMLAVRNSSPSGGPKGGKRQDWTDAVVALDEAQEKLRDEIVRLCKTKRIVGEAIDQVSVMNQRRVLELRYRNYMTWEEIAREIPCDVRTVYRLHGRALQKVNVPLFVMEEV